MWRDKTLARKGEREQLSRALTLPDELQPARQAFVRVAARQ
jgi:hypothetical protein